MIDIYSIRKITEWLLNENSKVKHLLYLSCAKLPKMKD